MKRGLDGDLGRPERLEDRHHLGHLGLARGREDIASVHVHHVAARTRHMPDAENQHLRAVPRSVTLRGRLLRDPGKRVENQDGKRAGDGT